MFWSIVVGLNLFSPRKRTVAPADDLDVALAGAQIGLERKRQRWLLFLIEKEEQCLNRIAQTTELDQSQNGWEMAHARGEDSNAPGNDADNNAGASVRPEVHER